MYIFAYLVGPCITSFSRPCTFQAKDLARNIKGFDRKDWESVAESIMERGLVEKFYQNPSARMFLKGTGSALIAEASRHDQFWGIGLDIQDPNITDTEKWQGANNLGALLMRVREKLS